MAVADGMGGRPGGEVASAIAVTLLRAAFTGSSPDELEAAVRAANRAIWERASEDEELEGMGERADPVPSARGDEPRVEAGAIQSLRDVIRAGSPVPRPGPHSSDRSLPAASAEVNTGNSYPQDM